LIEQNQTRNGVKLGKITHLHLTTSYALCLDTLYKHNQSKMNIEDLLFGYASRHSFSISWRIRDASLRKMLSASGGQASVEDSDLQMG